MSSRQLHTEDWRVLQSELASVLVMRGLSAEAFRAKVLCLERTGHLVFTVSPLAVIVTGRLIWGHPRWELPRSIGSSREGHAPLAEAASGPG